jgi:hypothetical protein
MSRDQSERSETSRSRSQYKETSRYYERNVKGKLMEALERSQSKGKSRENSQEPSFTPHINCKSQRMSRSGSVGEILYEDAMKR